MNLEREFSQGLAGDVRKETADKLRVARQQPESFKDLKKGESLEDYQSWPDITENFEKLKANIFGQIFKTEKYRSQEALLSEMLKTKKQHDIEKIKRDYDKKFDETLKNCPLTPEERAKYLSTEAMEKMPLEDYLVLLKRLSGEAFYHVTRYGVRENTFTSTGGGHTTGSGEFIDGFTPLLEDGNINSCSSTIISNEERAEASINKEFLKQAKLEGLSVEEVVDKVIESYGTGYFLDRESAHFSYGKELHDMYGGEDDYKFYFYYPVEYILQNDFYYSTREQITVGRGYVSNEHGINQQYNDFEIFNFGKGVPINAGILCVSGDIKVDPETGSQYELKDGQPLMDENGEFKKPAKTISSKDYWENYFMLHPELKPSKIIYGGFYSGASDRNQDLEELAVGKVIYKQNESKIQEFKDYNKNTAESLRQIFTAVVREEFETK